MTNEEKKANELIDSFRNYVDSEVAGDTDFVFSREEQTTNAKKCATIVVNEILKNIDATAVYIPTSLPILEINKKYWEDVKSFLI